MITIRKLRSLPQSTRVRKIIRLLDGFVRYRSLPEPPYLCALLELLPEPVVRGSSAYAGLRQTIGDAGGPTVAGGPADAELVRLTDALRHELRAATGEPVADWDLLPPAGYGSEPEQGGPLAARGIAPSHAINLYLESIRSPFNVGSIIRTAAALGVTRIGLSPDCPPADHPRVRRTAMGSEREVHLDRLPLSALDASWAPLLALEPGGTPLNSFAFPQQGTMMVGSEELGLSARARAMATEQISVPLSGAKGSINVGVACGIALYSWVTALATPADS